MEVNLTVYEYTYMKKKHAIPRMILFIVNLLNSLLFQFCIFIHTDIHIWCVYISNNFVF